MRPPCIAVSLNGPRKKVKNSWKLLGTQHCANCPPTIVHIRYSTNFNQSDGSAKSKRTWIDRVFLRLSHLFHGYPQFYDCAGLRTVRRYGTMPAGGKKWKINGKSEGESLYFSDKIIVITLKRKVYGKFYRCIYIIMFHILNGFLR